RFSVPTVSRRSTCRSGRTRWSSARAARPRRTDEHATDASSDATRRVGDREAARALPLAYDGAAPAHRTGNVWLDPEDVRAHRPRERGLPQHVRRDLAALHGAHRIG